MKRFTLKSIIGLILFTFEIFIWAGIALAFPSGSMKEGR
jgi:hypothetical protein